MRRVLIASAVAVALAGAGLVLLASPADAAVTSPGSGAVLRGAVTLAEGTGGVDSSTLKLCSTLGTKPATSLSLLNSANGVVFTTANAGGALSAAITSENYPNGTYTVQSVDTNVALSGLSCKKTTVTSNVPVTIDNIMSIAYSGVTSAPQGATVTVSATLTDPNTTPSALNGRTVTFALSGGATLSATTNASGVATASLPVAGGPRAATLTVSSAATANYDAVSQPIAFSVLQDPTTTSLTAVTTPSVHGQVVAFIVNVAAGIGTGAPTGSIQFSDNGTPLGAPVMLAADQAILTTGALSTGTHTIVANYSGDANFLASIGSAQQVVVQATTKTDLASSVNPSVSGQPVTFTANVSAVSPGLSAGLTGAVQFDVDGQPFGTAVPLTGLSAALTVATLSTGNHQVTATYDGATDYAASTSAALTQGVNMAASTTSISSSATTSVSGQPVSFTATVAAVAPGAGTPTGSVQFSVDGSPLGAPVALSGGTASTPTTTSIDPGTHHVTANYLGDANFSGSQDDLTQTVDVAQTTTSVASAANPSVFGQPVTFTATVAPVAPGAGTPSGQVQFLVNGAPTGDPVGLSGGTATSAPLSNLAPGSYSVTVAYAGDSDFAASTSAALTQTVNQAATSTALTSSVNPSVFGQPVTFTATVAPVAPGAGGPTGTVTFRDGATVIGTQPVGPGTGEIASITTGSLVVAAHAISATYSGDTDFTTSSASATQTVTRASSAVLVTSSANPAQSGQSVSFSAVVSAVAPGAGMPTGTVSFTINGAPLGGPVSLSGGAATSSAFASLSPGIYTVAASYSGDASFLDSSALLDEGTGQNIAQGATTMAVGSAPATAGYGQTVTFTADVTAVAPATGIPSGVVDFTDGGILLGSASLAPNGSSGRAVFADSTLTTGIHSITATYVGNFNFTGQSATTVQTIGTVATITTVASSVNPTVYQGATTFTAVVAANPFAAGTPTGSVTFSAGSTVLGTAPLSAVQGNQQAVLTVSSLPAGSYPITASYGGNAQFAASTSAGLTQVVVRAPTLLVAKSIVSTKSGLTVGEVDATLTGNGHPLAGQTVVFTTLSFQVNPVPVCTAVTNAQGVATCDSSLYLPTIASNGGYQAAFGGSADFTPSSAQGPLNN